MTQVLVVEDDRDTRQMLSLVLEDAGYTVAEATDGLEGLAAMQASTVPLVVLLDLNLPRLSGTEVLQQVARDTHLAGRNACILVTAGAYRQQQSAETICETLSVPLLMKPFKVDTLLDLVASAAHRLPSAPPDQS